VGRVLETVVLGELNPIGMLVEWLMKPIERLIRRRPKARNAATNDRDARPR
jgi:hypothetical protein